MIITLFYQLPNFYDFHFWINWSEIHRYWDLIQKVPNIYDFLCSEMHINWLWTYPISNNSIVKKPWK